MNKIKLFLLLLITLSFQLNALCQEISFDIDRGEVKRDKITERTYGIQALGKYNESVYYLYIPYKDVFGEISHGSVENHFIARFDNKLNETNKQEIILENDNRKSQLHGVSFIKNNLYLFSAFQNEKHKKHYLFAQTIDKESLLPEDNMQLIGEIDYSGINKYNTTYFHHKISPDSSKILVYYNVVNKDNENIKYGMYVYTDSMQLIWKNENVEPAISEGVFSFQEFKVDNNGNVYLKGINYTSLDNYYESANFMEREFFSRDTYYADVPNYTTQIYFFTENGTRRQYVNLSIPGKFIRSLAFLPVENDKLFCAGIYSNPGTISAIGSFVFNLDINRNEITGLNTKEFGMDLIELGFDDNQIKKFRRSIENAGEWDPFKYLLSEIYINEAGEKYFVAEQYIDGTKVEKSGNMTIYRTIFLHNDIFITSINKEDEIKRIDKISKRQYMLTTDHYNSYALLEKDNNLYFAYTEFIKKNTILKNAEPGNTYLVRLGSDGGERKSVLKDAGSKDKLYLMTRTSIKLSDNELIYSTISGNFKDYSLEKITIKE